MARNQVRHSGKQAGQSAWQWNIRVAFFWGSSALITGFSWLYLQRVFLRFFSTPRSVIDFLGLGLIHALLALALERSLASMPVEEPWRYRLAFLFSFGVALAQWVVFVPSPLFFTPVSYTLILPAGTAAVAATGAFLGGLFATRINGELWENNPPPAAWIQEEVLQRHLAVIGKSNPPPAAKRGFDLALACLGLLLSTPVWALISFLVWFEDPGPLLFVKNSVGKGGTTFRQLKFRTMVCGAENETGPVLSETGDQRVLLVGRFLRKTALDELPQLINILKGEMSFVGPRPQRTVLVHGYLEAIPEYAERHRVLPGLAGLAQVAGDYYLTAGQKLRFDRLYIRYTGLGFDLKLLLLAFLVTFWFRWQKNWNGRLPRSLLHSRRRSDA